MKTELRLLLLICATLFMFACGGGDSNPPPEQQPPTPAPDPVDPPPPPPPVTPPPTSYSISGTITAPNNAAVDSDVNDPQASYLANNSIETAQTIPTTVTLGGYVNLPFHGATGRSYLLGDQEDYYKVNLLGNQIINLQIADDPARVNLDLFLLDTAGTIVGSSVGKTASETVTVPPSGGTFYILVAICGDTTYHLYGCYPSIPADYLGASNYVLTIDGSTSKAAEAEFVPGELIVKFKQQQLGVKSLTAKQITLANRARALGLRGKAGGPDRPMLMSLGDARQTEQAFTRLGIAKIPSILKGKRFVNQKAQRKFETLWAIKHCNNALMLKRPVQTIYAKSCKYPMMSSIRINGITHLSICRRLGYYHRHTRHR